MKFSWTLGFLLVASCFSDKVIKNVTKKDIKILSHRLQMLQSQIKNNELNIKQEQKSTEIVEAENEIQNRLAFREFGQFISDVGNAWTNFILANNRKTTKAPTITTQSSGVGTTIGSGTSTTSGSGGAGSTTAPGGGGTTTSAGGAQTTSAPGVIGTTTASGAGTTTSAGGAQTTSAPGVTGTTTASGAGTKSSPGGLVTTCGPGGGSTARTTIGAGNAGTTASNGGAATTCKLQCTTTNPRCLGSTKK